MRLPTDSTARKLPTAAGSSARSTLVSEQPPFSARFWERLDTVVARRARELLFRGEKFLRPLDLDRLSRREIPKFIDGAWFG
jgi:hypothetical protein